MISNEESIVPPGPKEKRRDVPRALAERYEDIRFLGEGGMGVVYSAVDPKLGRKVALKLLKGADPDRRFVGEARKQARIGHEHICRVYEVGEIDGEPFIAMQFIDGEPFSKVRERLTLEERVVLMKEVCLAVHEAHRMGLIHRDLKPGNILVEERADGTKKPWVMDFGLAREVGEDGQTQTGAVLGTVAFMPPEQARGDVHAMDRRSDVYSLGATLYDVIAGRPPFVADNSWKLLMMVGQDEAPPLGKVKAGVPADLETIVMKCLEREPSRRYDSARALAEDLGRFLDGEPISAKRASVGYFVYKKVKKNKWLSASLFLAFLSAAAGAGVWVHAQRQGALREKLAQELGESVKEMELFLRAAYALPLHDIELERDVVRDRLGEFEARLATATKAEQGPLHYAIGRGHLALGDAALAREHLENAIAFGYSSADLEFALGRALGELFRRAVEETKRITNKEEQKKKVEELERTLRDPALLHLRGARGARIESPLYAEGLVALYEGKNEEAIEKARNAFKKAPWLYEPKKLEGDALFAEGSKYRHDAAFDYEKMKSYFEPAAAAYKIAAEMGSSDPEAYRAECELWEKMAHATAFMGKSASGHFDLAETACSRAVEASSRDGRARVQRALVLQSRFFSAVQLLKDVEAAQKAAFDAVDEAVRSMPNDPMALYARASAFYALVMKQAEKGEPLSVEEAVDAFQRVLDIDPRFTWALSELGQTYLTQAQVERLHGKDPRAAIAKAIVHFERAREVDPTFAGPAAFSLRAHSVQLSYETEHGIDGEATLKQLKKAVLRFDDLKMGGWFAAFWKARALRVHAAYELSRGDDPRKHVAEGLAEIHAFSKPGTETDYLLRERIELRLVEADFALRNKLPRLDFDREALVLRDFLRGSPDEFDSTLLLARIELYLARSKADAGEAVHASDIEATMASLVPLLSRERDDPRGYEVLADIHAEKALLRVRDSKALDAEVEAGLSMVEKVLKIDPHHPRAFLLKGKLLRAKATAAQGAEEEELRMKAKQAFLEAIRENPWLKREVPEELGREGR